MPNIIKQIIKGSGDMRTIRMVVRSNERGPQGEQGVPGDAATIAAGEAYSVASDSNPAVINTGTASNAVFDFYIPKGEKGETGADGKDGKDGAIHYTAGAGITINDENVIAATGATSVEWGLIEGNITNQTDLTQALAAKADTSSLATVATSGSYNDLSNKPTIPAAQVNSDWNASTGVAAILNKPTIPIVNDSTITITNNGSTVDSFTTNASSAKTIALSAPVITLTDTDPGEGAALAANNFICVYDAS